MDSATPSSSTMRQQRKRGRKQTLVERVETLEALVTSLQSDNISINKLIHGKAAGDQSIKGEVMKRFEQIKDWVNHIDSRIDRILNDGDTGGKIATYSNKTYAVDESIPLLHQLSSQTNAHQEKRLTTDGATNTKQIHAYYPTLSDLHPNRKGKTTVGRQLFSELLQEVCGKRPNKTLDSASSVLGAQGSSIDAAKVPLPNGMKIDFHPTKGMKLSQQELEVAAFIFSSEKTAGEILVECASGDLSRGDLKSLVPDNWVYGVVLTMVATRMTHAERKHGYIRHWFFPPHFAQLTIDKTLTPEKAMRGYSLLYMSNSVNNVDKVYIPLNDENTHWFLLIVSFRDEKLIYLDSDPSPTTEERRHQLIKSMAAFVWSVLKDRRIHNTRWRAVPDISSWLIVAPVGVPRQENFYDCGIWTAGWMTLDPIWGDFKTVPRGDIGRMRLALDLVLGEYNTRREQVLLLAKDHWGHKGTPVKLSL